MRVALFGGSFDPPHRGHIALARLARERLSLDRIFVAPVATQPLKQETLPAGFEDRVVMAKLAFAGEAGAEVSLLDAPREDGSSNYTLDTLTELQQHLNPQDRLFCIVGADSILSIGKWHRPVELLTTCDFIAGARPGFDLGDVEAALPEGLRVTRPASMLPHTEVLELTGPDGRTSRLYLLMDLAVDVSATEVRAALRGDGEPADVLTPAVMEYIRAHHLYAHL
jgi:nicotinate-nucleotide adenylyltransferase